MKTVKEVTEILRNRKSYQVKELDHAVTAINLFRIRIPRETCRSIISGALRDKVFLCEVEKALPYLQEEDLTILAECNVGVEDEYFYIYV